MYRKARADIDTYKILNDLVESMGASPLRLAEQDSTHSLKLETNHCRTALRQHTFSQWVVDSWNALPEAIVAAPTLNPFKNRLDRY